MFEAHLLEVFSIAATAEPDVYMLDLETVDGDGVISRDMFCSRPDDPHGFGPLIRVYLAENVQNFVVIPYQPVNTVE